MHSGQSGARRQVASASRLQAVPEWCRHPSRCSARMRVLSAALGLVGAAASALIAEPRIGLASPAAGTGRAGNASAGRAAVSLAIESPMHLRTLAPGSPVAWEIWVQVSADGNAGLALISVDLRPDPANPAPIQLAPSAEIPEPMQVFTRPLGIDNPPASPGTAGYVGSVAAGPGGAALLQIGGAQNPLGHPGSAIGTQVPPTGGIALGKRQLLAQGQFPTPSLPGMYTVSLDRCVAMTFDAIASPPAKSSVRQGAVTLEQNRIVFFVVPAPHDSSLWLLSRLSKSLSAPELRPGALR